MAKAPAKRTSRKTTEKARAVEAAQTEAATTMDPQTGMDVVHAEKPSKAALERQFKEADAKGDPDKAAQDEAALGLAMRGY